MKSTLSAFLVFIGFACTYRTSQNVTGDARQDLTQENTLAPESGGNASTGGTFASGGTVSTQEISINLAPSRQLDLIFLIDNSFEMISKHEKLKAQFPLLINALRDSTKNPQLPDLRIAIVSSDLGAGASKICTPRFGDQGKFLMPDSKECGVNAGATFLEYTSGRNVNFTAQRDIADVFGCLVGGVGQDGCGLEQQLQALYFSLFLTDPATQKTQADSFIRPLAPLGIVILTDEDDCSTPINSLIGHQSSMVSNESYSLRCATRGHQCAGATLNYPTSAPSLSDFYACSAREDTCPASETGENPTSCTPLENVKNLADKIKSVKTVSVGGRQVVDIDQFVVAGIFGWPRKGQSSATYKIDKVPNPAGKDLPGLFEYWPVCFDPNYPLPTDANKKDQIVFAFGEASYGGLRIKAFLDEFPKNSSLAFSSCEPDYKESMIQIGQTLASKLKNICLPRRLLDADESTPGVEPQCRVFLRVPTEMNGKLSYSDEPEMPHCNLATEQNHCWRLVSDAEQCPTQLDAVGNLIPSQKVIVDSRDQPIRTGTKVIMQCQTCPEAKTYVQGCSY